MLIKLDVNRIRRLKLEVDANSISCRFDSFKRLSFIYLFTIYLSFFFVFSIESELKVKKEFIEVSR